MGHSLHSCRVRWTARLTTREYLILIVSALLGIALGLCIGLVEGHERGAAYSYASVWQWCTPGNPEFRECKTSDDALREIRRRLPMEQVITGAELGGNRNIRLWDSRVGLELWR